MQLRIERDISHHYIIPLQKVPYQKDDYQIHMLTENKVAGLLPMSVHHMDGMCEYYFDITGKTALAQVYETEFMKEEDILRLIRAIKGVIHEIERYLLVNHCILLDPACIFVDDKGKFQFCYLPGYEATLEESFCSLAEYILHHLNQNEQAAVLLGYEIYRQVSQKNYSLEKVLVKAFDNRGEEEKKEPTRRERIILSEKSDQEGKEQVCLGKNTTDSDKAEHVKKETEKLKRKKETSKTRKEKLTIKERKDTGTETVKRGNKLKLILCGIFGLSLFAALIVLMKLQILTTTQGGGIAFLLVGVFGFVLSGSKTEKGKEKQEVKSKETTIKPRESKRKNEEMATTVLWDGEEEYQPKLSLIGMNSRERMTVILQKETYLVGKQKSKVDIYLNDPAVSRVHARIAKNGEDYYLTDLNSTNGTFYNGKRLENGEKVKLELTDEITFAETGFYIGNC